MPAPKHDWPLSQFEEHLPVYLAERFIKTEKRLIEAQLEELGPDSLVKHARSYAREPVGEWLVRHSNFVQYITSGLKRGTPLEQDLYVLLGRQDSRLVPASNPTAKHWQELRALDPEHPVFGDPFWNITLSGFLAKALGTFVQETEWWKRHIQHIRRDVGQLKVVRRIMES